MGEVVWGWPSSWGLKYACATTSGITALHPALKALGVGPGDEVITTPFTYAALRTVVLHADAVPIFADIDRETLNLDSASVESEITDMTKAVVVAHLASYPPDLKTASMSQSARGCRPEAWPLYVSCGRATPNTANMVRQYPHVTDSAATGPPGRRRSAPARPGALSSLQRAPPTTVLPALLHLKKSLNGRDSPRSRRRPQVRRGYGSSRKALKAVDVSSPAPLPRGAGRRRIPQPGLSRRPWRPVQPPRRCWGPA
jgi:hypothetical protein